MNNAIFALLLTLVSTSAFAGRYAGPFLVKATGEIAHAGEARVCKIYHNHPGLKDRLGEVVQLIEEASQQPIDTALHFRAEVPSIEIYGVKVVDAGHGVTSAVRGEKVLLVEDYSVAKTRRGEAAAKLVQITEELCE